MFYVFIQSSWFFVFTMNTLKDLVSPYIPSSMAVQHMNWELGLQGKVELNIICVFISY